MASGVSRSARSHSFRPYRSFGAIVLRELRTASLVNLASSEKTIRRAVGRRALPHNNARTTCRSGLVTQNPVAALPLSSGGGTGVDADHAQRARRFGGSHSVYLICF